MSYLESKFQKEVIDDLQRRYPGAILLKSDPNYIQGIPDLLFLHGDTWAALECKRSIRAPLRPNQRYYVNLLNKMSYSSFIYPENKEDVYHEIQRALRLNR